MPVAVEVVDLVREFTDRGKTAVRALDRVSLEVPPGEVHGLLGPNGAGKTTLVKILSTVLLPTAGRACVSGADVVSDATAVRRRIGIVFGGERGLYTRLTARQNLMYWGALYRLSRRQVRTRAAELLDRVGLTDQADRRVETYSRGMKQRLHLARGLIAGAQVLFLDEPTSGMDPIAAHEFRQLIGELRVEGRTIMLATHDMAEAEILCDRVTLIDRGRVLATRSPRELGQLLGRSTRVDVEDVDGRLLDRIERLPGVGSVVRRGAAARISVSTEDSLSGALKFLVDNGVVAIAVSHPTLEEAYIGLIGDRGLNL